MCNLKIIIGPKSGTAKYRRRRPCKVMKASEASERQNSDFVLLKRSTGVIYFILFTLALTPI